ncbi:MAG: hypothetical protein RLY95_1142 [Pseudomonadota bacterium]|jgi:hypothetical protein
MRQGEHVLYITLIDFLLQLLFLGLVIAVIFAAAQPNPEDIERDRKALEQIKSATGISDITVLTDMLTRLGPVVNVVPDATLGKEIKDIVEKIGGKDAAIAALKAAASKGQGRPSCLSNGVRLATFNAYPDRIDLQPSSSKELDQVLNKLHVKNQDVASLSLSQFEKIFTPIKLIESECIYNVTVIEHSFDTRPRDAIRKAFNPIPLPANNR